MLPSCCYEGKSEPLVSNFGATLLLGRFGLGSGFDQPANPTSIVRCGRIVDDQAKVGAPIDCKSRVFQRKQPGNRMPQLFRAFAMGANIVFTPDRLKFGAEKAEFIDQGVNISRCAGSRSIRAKGRDGEPRYALPVELRGADLWIKEDFAQDIALCRGK